MNRGENAFDVSKNIVVPESKNAITVFSQATITYHVCGGFIVLAAIDFNDQTSLATNEIADVTEYRHLPDEFVSVDLPVADAILEHGLCICLIDA